MAAEAQVEVTDRELQQPDALLGRLADQDVDVHRRVVARIGVSSSKLGAMENAKFSTRPIVVRFHPDIGGR